MFLLVRSLTRHTGARARRRLRVRLPAVSLHALRAPRAADGAVDAAVPVGVAPTVVPGQDAGRPADRRSSWRCRRCRRSYYGIFFATFLVPVGAALLIGIPGATSARRVAAAAGRRRACSRQLWSRRSRCRTSTRGNRSASGRMSEIEFYSATPQNYLAAHPRNALFGSLDDPVVGGRRSASCFRASRFR